MDIIEKILALLEKGQQQEALIEYKKILNSGSAEEKFSLAEELFQFGFIDEAKALYENLLQAYPDEGELLVLLAETCIELGDEDQAMLALEKVTPADSSYPQALLLLADLYQINGLYEVSEQKLKSAKQLLSDEVVIDFAMGELYAEQGKVTEAIRAYQAVLLQETEIAGVIIHQRIADILSSSGSFEEALPHYEQALNEKLEINTLFGYAFTALQAGFNRTAIEKFNEIKSLDPDYHSLYLPLAKAYEREEQLLQSFETVKEGIRQDEFNKDLFFYGGKIALKLAEEDEAERLFREALALDPAFTEAALTLNKLFIKQERYENVIDLIKELDIQEEEEPQLIWDEALALQNLEKYSHALNKYEHAYTFFKNDHEFLNDYGYFLIEEGKNAKAAEIFIKLLKGDPSNEDYQQMIERLTDELPK
ncbi:tetratricopeptide repeat protein [Bacillus sp. V33-4]|uniref:tetratricopeptide repeat protein n=1 Tax=Bacillus sp. V33-4 TaxID=2054169 RepID=UPI000C75A335|nr:tetratricopeptide repeat protein [Bacillus sp. V33-4]PLR82658.1 hypothetical protein CVD23_15740 [Bacillus sp. V33-4]